MNTNHDNLRRFFQEGFSVRDIAEPLPSFDGTAPGEHVRDIMSSRAFDVVGIRADGIITGYVERTDLSNGCCGDVARRFDDSQLVAETLPLAQLAGGVSCAAASSRRSVDGTLRLQRCLRKATTLRSSVPITLRRDEQCRRGAFRRGLAGNVRTLGPAS